MNYFCLPFTFSDSIDVAELIKCIDAMAEDQRQTIEKQQRFHVISE
jgi:hypothetical protein